MSVAPSSADSQPPAAIDEAVLTVVLEAMRTVNLARDPAAQLVVSADAAIFGPASPLDSLGLVALLLDVEEGLQALGYDVTLSDERAVSQKRSPFRSVRSLVEYVGGHVRVA